MHRSSYFSMLNFKNKYIGDRKNYSVLDVGGSVIPTGCIPGIGGSYKPIFPDTEYVVLDYKSDNPEVSVPDIIIDGYDWPIEDEKFDVIICGQVFEHDKFFWLTLNNMKRVLKKEGLLCIIAPSAGPVHKDPIDCYRFYDDCMIAFAEWMDIKLLESSKDINSVPFQDMKGVFKK